MQTKIIITSGVLLIALAAIWRELQPPPAQANPALSIGIGQILTDEVVRSTGGKGEVVVVQRGAGTRQSRRTVDLRAESFRAELKQHPNLRLAPPEFVAFEEFCSVAAFKEICDRHAAAAAIVFLVGLPNWVEVGDGGEHRPGPAIIVVDTDSSPTQYRYGGYFANGLLGALISFRATPASVQSTGPTTPREWFAQMYQVYTPQNYEMIPQVTN